MAYSLPPWFQQVPIPAPYPSFRAPPVPMPQSAAPAGANLGSTAQPDMWGRIGNALGDNSNALIGLGMGLLSKPRLSDAIAAAGGGWMAGEQADQQAQQFADARKAKTATQKYLESKHPDLAAMLAAGSLTPEQAVGEAMKREAPGYGQRVVNPGDTVLGPDNQVVYQAPTKPPPPPTGYQWADPNDPSKGVTAIKNGPADDSGDAAAIADAIARGEQPPTTTGLYHLGAPVRANLARRGYDLATAQQDYTATQRRLASMNSTQQVRLQQAVDFTNESLGTIEDLAKQWDGGQFPILNKANLVLAMNGAYGQQAASLATRLNQQINDMTSELANVYMGGNSPTDHAMQLAGSNLSADWSKQTLLDAVGQIRKNLTYRANSMRSVQTQGIPNSQYNPMDAPSQQPPQGASTGQTFTYNPVTGNLE